MLLLRRFATEHNPSPTKVGSVERRLYDPLVKANLNR